MRIAVVSSKFPVLSQTFVLNQITALIDAGHEVIILAERPEEAGPVHRDVDSYGLLERTIYWDGAGSSLWTKLKAVGLRQVVGSIRGEQSWEMVKRAAYLDGVEPFDAIICHFGTVGLECQVLREMGALRGPLITVFHGYDMSLYVKEKGSDVYQELLERGELFLPISQFWKERLESMGAETERTIVHHMGIDPERFSYQHRAPGAEDEIRILSIGRFVEKKGFEYGLRAFAAISGDHPQVCYTIVGDGVLRPELEVLSRELGIAERVDFTGWADRKEVKKMLYEHQILMVPSVTAETGDMEGIPVVLMEGMATGMPVITTKHSGIPELVSQHTGLLAEERNVDELAAHLRSLVDDPKSWESMGKRARAIVERDFCLSTLNEKLVDLVEAGIEPR